jgi:sulfonate transport system permease protein
MTLLPSPSVDTASRYVSGASPVPGATSAANRGAYQDGSTAAGRRTSSDRGRAGRFLVPYIVPVLLLSSWYVLSTTGVLPTRILPAPGAVLAAAATLVRSGDLARDLAVSAGRAGAGLAIGGSAGFLLGLFTGANRTVERLLGTTVQMFRTIPNLALIPLVIVWLGIGEPAKVVLIALGVFFPMYLNTHQGVRTVDAGLVEMARSYGIRGLPLFLHVLLPGAMPSVLTGLRFALGATWLTLISAEALAADSGIGYMTTTAREFMQTDIVLVGVLLYAALGIAADVATRLLERTLLQWHPSYLPNAGK